MACLQSVVRLLQEIKEENWCLPIMYVTCMDLRLLALKCESLEHTAKRGQLMEKAAECLMSCFRICAADSRTEIKDTKRIGMLHLVNQVRSFYFSHGCSFFQPNFLYVRIYNVNRPKNSLRRLKRREVWKCFD